MQFNFYLKTTKTAVLQIVLKHICGKPYKISIAYLPQCQYIIQLRVLITEEDIWFLMNPGLWLCLLRGWFSTSQ